VKHINRR